ncbi:MAG TPA: prepilin-type N-terminal cleavage/methylation domain-containing protein [Tenericutes bacterium]|jgi:type IV pilus assembly protein PilA|nr:prepilin-type N-terminal cleavage/methylation domain-containing protein [Mycoplasmatota bacterium]
MSRGFTLIELLAVIVILGLILAIAIPSFSSLIQKNRFNAFRRNEELLVKQAQIYLTNNTNLLPTDIGEKKEVLYTDIKEQNYIDIIKDSIDGSE